MSVSDRVPTIAELTAELGRRSHLDFMKQTWQREFDPLVVGRHTRAICERFDRAMEDFKVGISTFLAIMCCQGHGKSQLSSIHFPAHFIGEFPDLPVVVTGYSSNLVEGFSASCQEIVRSEKFAALYPGVKVSKKKQSVDEWWIEGRAGRLYWPGLTGSITGKRGALQICDDFFSGAEEADSLTIRDARWNTLRGDFFSRADRTSIVIVLATPWHVDDIFGRIKKEMQTNEKFPAFEFLKFPAESPEYGGEGTLFPERYNRSWYDNQKALIGPYRSAALMQCNPTVEHGNILRVDRIKYYEKAPDGLTWKRGWDIASSSKQTVKQDPDFTASVLLGIAWEAGPVAPVPTFYIEDFTQDRLEAPARDRRIKQKAIEDGESVEIGIEAYGPYKDAFTNLEAALWGFRKVTKVNLPGDKKTRISTVGFESALSDGRVYIKRAAWNDDLIKSLAEFTGTKDGPHDDPEDAIVTAAAMHKPFVKHVWPAMASIQTVPFDIHWTKHDERNSIHYGAVVLKRDLSLWVLCTLWDNIAEQFFLYDSTMFEQPDIQKIVQWLTAHMKLRTHKVDRILCNERMCESTEGEAEKTMQSVFRDEFKRIGVGARLNESIHFDQWGSIGQMTKVINAKKLFVNDVCDPALQQFVSWSVENNKPVNENSGWCECLCLIVSELKKKGVFDVGLPKRQDYQNKDKVPVLRGGW